ncbi:MAG: hypothetical protein PVJ86_07375 [Phycisphaerales bacterium]
MRSSNLSKFAFFASGRIVWNWLTPATLVSELLQPTSSKAQHRRTAKEKMETEPEPKAKPSLPIFLLLTFPVILASIEKVMVRLFANFLPLAIETLPFCYTEKIFARKNFNKSKKM